MDDKRFALLIDSDNISAKYIDVILDEMTRHGIVTYRRIYGDFTTNQMHRWKDELAERVVHPGEVSARRDLKAVIRGAARVGSG